ncbi:CDP-glycerol glycerophosphotransferase, TagB/SpsB family [Friedmanniella luteola]|uniref:CDP-glycerol glycerophosphotransferase, TagB/SpsB family n=1 Tax=Friedmanniella luteola TaxID=546871 RepID=A0A1H1U0T0_9ACTN|nr:CDP-glycerol glycerophosphotransferase family protein [Friedmanniella luteola]SDS65974.1 CDP-glycerol glycerophosphotransferase, TagB/SpsB family [Friedmanniella luteola]
MDPDEISPGRRRARELLLDVLAAVSGVGGLLLDRAGEAAGALAVLGAVLAVTLRIALLARGRAAGWSPLGQLMAVRAVPPAVLGALLALRADGPAEVVAAVAGAGVLLGCLTVEPVLARAARFTVPLAVRLPGLPAAPTSPPVGPLAVVTASVAVAAGVVVALLGLSPWWWLGCTVAAAVPFVVLAVTGRAKVLAARQRRTLVPQAVADYAPEFVVYTSRPDDASYQVLMWLPYLQRAGLRFLVVTRNAVPAAALAEQTDVPVVEARSTADLEALVGPSLKAAFYVNASSGNGAMVRFQHLTHIYLGHGDSDKPPSYNPTHAMYDAVFAAGPAAARRYAAHGVRIPAEKFRVVGRPQVEDVHQVDRPISAVTEPVVLYAPTWRGHVEETMLYSLPGGERIVQALLDRGATVVFRPHPFSYDFADDAAVIGRIHDLLAADARRTGRAHLWGAAAESERGILDCINVSDAMVSDVSSVVVDYLFSGKPFAMVAVPAEPPEFLAEFPVAAASYVVRGDLADLDGQLTAMLGPDPLREQRLALRADYLGDFPAEHYADAFVDAVRHVARQSRADQETEDRGDVEAEEAPGAEDARPGAEDEVEQSRAAAGLRRYSGLLLGVGLGLVAVGVALVALLTAVLDGPAWLPAGLALLAVVLQVVSARRGRTDARLRLSDRAPVVRALLLATLVVVAGADGVGWPVVAALLVLAVGLVAERTVEACWGGFGLQAVHLPAAVRPVRELLPREWPARAWVGTVLVALVLLGPVARAWPGARPSLEVVLLVVTAVLLGAVALVLVQALRRAVEVSRGEERLRGALEAWAPEFAVYFASTVGAAYQLGMWLPYFVRTGRRFVVITRTLPMLRQVAQLCEEQGVVVPVVHRPTLRSLEDVIVPSMTSAFYVNNAVRNTHFIERRELTHVWLNHGDSEKPACYNPVHAIYDLIFAAGQAGIDRYARHGVHIPEEKFLVVGRPQVEQIEAARGPVAEQQPPTVLYAPTWQGPYADSRVFSLPVGEQVVAALLARGCRVVFRAHPFNYRYPECRAVIASIGALLDADRERTGRQHLWGPAAESGLSVEDCFNLSDAMVADVSAVVSDYLRSEKPFAMVSVGRTPEQLLVEAPAARAAYVLREDLSNLETVLDELLVSDPKAAVRRETRVYYLGEFAPGQDAEGFLTAARDVVDGRYASAEAAAHRLTTS